MTPFNTIIADFQDQIEFMIENGQIPIALKEVDEQVVMFEGFEGLGVLTITKGGADRALQFHWNDVKRIKIF